MWIFDCAGGRCCNPYVLPGSMYCNSCHSLYLGQPERRGDRYALTPKIAAEVRGKPLAQENVTKKKTPEKTLANSPYSQDSASTATRRIQIYPSFMLVLDHPVSKFWLAAKSVKKGENGKYFSGKFAFIIVTSSVGFEMTFHTNWARELQKFFFPFSTLHIKPVANYRVEHVCFSIGCVF